MRPEIKKRNLEKSEELWKRAIKVIPAGTQCYSHGPTQYVTNASPKFISKGKGCFVWDVDGNKYLDFTAGGFPIILGYGYKPVADAAYRELKRGTLFPMMNPLEVEVSELLIDAIPSAEMVRFAKNGSDVCSMAVRAARAFTGRDLIVSQGYHGTHDWYICTTERNKGIPKDTKDHIKTFRYNDLDRFKELFEKRGEDVACVIMEPVQLTPPKDNFLKNIKKIANKNGAVLIFDEIITGFRFSLGGAQQFFNVTPDLSCFGKSIANGLPLSALVGKKEIMEEFGFNNKAFFSGTFGGETSSLAAGKKTIEEIKDKKVIPFIWKQGKRLRDSFNQLIKEQKLDNQMACLGYPVWNNINFFRSKEGSVFEKKSLFQQEVMGRGILAELTHATTLAHNDISVNKGLKIYDESMKSFNKKISEVERGKNIRSFIKGDIIKPVFKRLD